MMSRACLNVAVALLTLLMCAAGCGAEEGGDGNVNSDRQEAAGVVRRPVWAGPNAFYPSDPEVLARDIDGYLAAAETPELAGEIVALICPHAGYRYSGQVAAKAYAHVRDVPFDAAIVVAPSHRFAFRIASVYGGDGYATPLGVVPVDRELADAISDPSNGFGYEPRAHSEEHSLEVQVPFLQRALGEFRIVPIVMGEQTETATRLLASRIAKAVKDAPGKRVLLVASTDLSHFHDQDTAVELDSHVLEAVEDFDPEGLLASLARGECEACGGGPAAVVMMAARELGARESTVVGYATSGDVAGDKSRVVGYMAAVLHGAPPAKRTEERVAGAADDSPEDVHADAAGAPYGGLTERERSALVSLARRSIAAELAGHWPPPLEFSSKTLRTERGAFVTLEKRGALRGCIGHVLAYKPLEQTVMEMAVQAALHDPRFPPVTADELDELTIEISVMSPLTAVEDVSEIEVGAHGLVIRDGGRSGLLLPQVATDYGWDRETFLQHTCAKAGLPPDAWKQEGVSILKFTAEVFGEEQP
ncbi:MAG: AmmeMemoRadiSam system protein B [Candidatus Eisenbacteria bacterium]